VTVGSRLIFRESNSKGMGNVTQVYYLGDEEKEAEPQPTGSQAEVMIDEGLA